MEHSSPTTSTTACILALTALLPCIAFFKRLQQAYKLATFHRRYPEKIAERVAKPIPLPPQLKYD
jgi:hypothetical protein